MWRSPGANEELLKKYGCLDDIYNAMRSSDLADVVYTAINVIKKTGSVPILISEKKSEARSTEFRKLGNEAYSKKNYNEALVFYNKALKYAPNKSNAMKLVFSNRSALLMAVKAYSACMSDIDTCFEMGCPHEIELKLMRRQKLAFDHLRSETDWLPESKFANSFFRMSHEPNNPQISCATMDVGVIMEDNYPKIVAARDVKVGTVLAVEPAFVTVMDTENLHIACYNCQTLGYNLIPCEGCCYVMFCDTDCMNQCMNQYHTVECKIIGLFESNGCTVECTQNIRLAIKAAIKMKLQSPWKKIIEDSKLYGMERIKQSSINQIYDVQENLSLLSFKENRNFIYGNMYNASFILAVVLYYMSKTSFFPYDYKERQEAIKCLARIMMYLTLYGTPTVIHDAAVSKSSETDFHELENFGLFALVGKLRNSCIPNTMSVGLNYEMALVALEPIARGTELTVSYLGHWLDKDMDSNKVRNSNMFTLYASVCNCVVCSGDWQHRRDAITPAQQACYKKLNFRDINFNNLSATFKNLCKIFVELHNAPFSEEYKNVYKLLRTCLLNLQQKHTENAVLEKVLAKPQVL